MPRTLITGLHGFTGRYVAAELRVLGHEVYGLEPLTTSTDGVAAAPCNLEDAAKLHALVQEIAPEYVVHLAGIASVDHGQADMIYRTNVIGTRNMLEALKALKTPPKSIILASSANIYGNAPQVENGILDEDTAFAPANDYAVSKAAMEYLAGLYRHILPIVIARPFNYTGVGQSERFLIPKIVAHFRKKAPVIELGNIDVARDFSDVRFVAQAYVRLLHSPAAHGQAYNLCSGLAYTITEVLAMLTELTRHKIEVRVNPAFVRANEVKLLRGDRTRLDKTIGALPTIPFIESLQWMLG
jgi:GDP-6-deoxy-D-talose 4-dehydrogenase